jgi:hypothetical protein
MSGIRWRVSDNMLGMFLGDVAMQLRLPEPSKRRLRLRQEGVSDGRHRTLPSFNVKSY